MADSPLRIRALGVDVTVRLDPSCGRQDAADLVELWAPAAPGGGAAGDPASASVQLVAGIARPGESLPPGVTIVGSDYRDLAARLSSHVTLAAIEEQKTELVMLHACGAASSDGRVVAFVGPSGRGKTTLASRVGRRYGYVTDETVGIREDGGVLAYRKPLSVIDPEVDTATKTQVSSDRLGLLPLPAAGLAISTIALIERDAGAPEIPEVTEVELVDAIVRLVPELSYLPRLRTPLQRLARLVDRVGGVVQLRYRDAADVPEAVPALLGRAARCGGWTAVEPGPPAGALPLAGQIVRAPALDGIRVGGQLVLLHGTEVTVLDGIGPAVWDCLVAPADLADLTTAVVALLGAPEGLDPAPVVAEAVETLTSAGVLRTVEAESGAGAQAGAGAGRNEVPT